MSYFKEALLYTSLSSGVAHCGLCPRHCVILPCKGKAKKESFAALKKENIGYCGTRVNFLGKLYAINYGRVTSLAADPVEKKPLYHFYPGEKLLSFGSFGCNFRCPNCHNWEISQTSSLVHNQPNVLNSILDSFSEISPAEIISQAVEYNCIGIAYTYNEPTVSLEFNLEVMKLARKAKLKNVWVSNGFTSGEALKTILPFLDAANIDLKSYNEQFYKSHCRGSLVPVVNNIIEFRKSGIHLEITTLLIPGLNNDEKIIRAISAFISKKISPNTPWHLLDFSASISWQMGDWQSASQEDLNKARAVGKEEGLKFIYASGLGGERNNTYCPHCKALNIERVGYKVEREDENGTCYKCGQKLFING